MARRDIDIGIEGNDGTGDSIRESFRKVNENFAELFRTFGEGGEISFIALGDTPEVLVPNSIPFVNPQGSQLINAELASNSALNDNLSDTITFDYSQPGKIILTSNFTKVADDQDPTLSGPLNASGNAIANVAIDEDAVIDFNNRHGTDINIDNVVITKGYADRRYISGENALRVDEEPDSVDQYTIVIDGYSGGNLVVPGHGLTRQINGTAYVFEARYDVPSNLENGSTYFLRYETDDQLSLFNNREDSTTTSRDIASNRKIFIDGVIDNDDQHTLTDAAYDSSLPGNFLANVALPRESVVRRQGDEMEGALFLNDHPGDLAGFGNINGEDDLQAASKLYVDNSAYSSPENLFVSTFGDDSMVGVPQGREGTALAYAYRTIGAAAKRAAEIIQTSPAEPGPYFQTITVKEERDALITSARIDNPVNTQARKLIENNITFLVNESIAFLQFEFPNAEINEDLFREYYEKIIRSIAFDINRGESANFLTIRAAESFYNSIDGRIAITRRLNENLAGIDFLKSSVSQILVNDIYRKESIAEINVDGDNARIKTSNNHNYKNGNQIIFRNVGPSIEINNLSAYIRVIDNETIELYEDSQLENLWDVRPFTDIVGNNFTLTPGGSIGLVYQERIKDYNSIKTLQYFDEPSLDETVTGAVNDKFENVKDIIEKGIDSPTSIVYGANYKIVFDNSVDDANFVDQAAPTNTDTLPGKIMVGKISGAKGSIVSLINKDPLENDNDSFLLRPLSPVDFIEGEPVEYGNFVKTKQVTINVESGIYEEDFPIKLSNNVSLKGDEFRRVIIRPKKRISQSIWANSYFYRDLEFDDILLLNRYHSEINEVATTESTKLNVDVTDWIELDIPVRFVGKNLIVPSAELEKNKTYYITDVDRENSQISVSDTPGGPSISLTQGTGTMYVVLERVAPFLNQTNQVQGYFGRHYLEDPYEDKNVGTIPNNQGRFNFTAEILDRNLLFIETEVIARIDNFIIQANQEPDTTSIWYDFEYDREEFSRKINSAVSAIIKDLRNGGAEFSLEVQGNFYLETSTDNKSQLEAALSVVSNLSSLLLNGISPEENGSVRSDTSLGQTTENTVTLVGLLVELIKFGFDVNYNPAKRNDADGVDVFMMSDATIARNITVQGHGGFMVVLDPEEQILTKSPYIQTGSSFSKSDNAKRFRGGMYVDAFVGNIPARITKVITETGAVGSFELEVESDENQGLRIREPQLPCPFYLDGIRYQVNAIGLYDSGLGTATLFLDKGSNPNSSGIGQGYQGTVGQEIFLQTAGNRSMLGNDFTQINDLGYGLVTNNGAFSEMVSMFTYYCHAAYYAKNGSEIRSLNGSNGYGFFGLVSEGADPNEIPDQVTLRNPLVYPAKAYTTVETPNAAEEQFLYIYDIENSPTVDSIVTIDHGPEIGVLNYRVSDIVNLSDRDNDGIVGNSPDDLQATGGTISNNIYRLSFVADSAIPNDFFGSLQGSVLNNDYIEIRESRTLIFDGVRDVTSLTTRPSTAINFDESDSVTYRSLAFSNSDSLSIDLPDNTVLATVETDFQFIELEVQIESLTAGFGATQGDTLIPVVSITDEQIDRLLRDINGNLPGDLNYNGGGLIFSFAGKTHRVINYSTDSSSPYIEIEDFGPNISTFSGEGLAEGIPSNRDRILYVGLPANSTAEITQAISLLRATGHDFTQIGTGGFNDSNYPNVILGSPINDPEQNSYTDSPVAGNAQVWERRKGRVFFVSTDQDGFFRVGKFFSVDQSTGDIEFAGEIGLTGANSLGFRKGVTINEFSADDSFSDNSGRAVPTERATGDYIDRVLGYNISSDTPIPQPPAGNRLGPGFLPLNGRQIMQGSIDMGGNSITNLSMTDNNDSAVNREYVDKIIKSYDEIANLRNIELNNPLKDDIVVVTGKKKIIVDTFSGGTWNIGDKIGTLGGNKTGTVVDIENQNDTIDGNIVIVTYTPDLDDSGDFESEEVLYDIPDEVISTQIIDGPLPEFANASSKSSSVIDFNVERQATSVTYDLQIKNNSVTNDDISANASIDQSKLNLNSANTRSSANELNQSNLGIASFDSAVFSADNGWITINDGQLPLHKIQRIQDGNVLGNISGDSSDNDIDQIPFTTIINEGGGLLDSDFDNTIIDTDIGSPGNALVSLGNGVYGVTEISKGIATDSIAKRTQNGRLDATGYNVSGFEILSVSSTTLQLKTPGGASVFSSVGTNSSNLVTRFPGNIDVGNTQLSQESNFQSNSELAGEGWLATDWIYTSFIEAPNERDSASTGIGIGANTGFASAGDNIISLITNGSESIVVSANNTAINTGTVTFDADLASNITPDSNSIRSLGSNSLRFNTVYADIFNGVATEAKYADLAEKYSADNIYGQGTVLVFGGKEEITTTNKKGDRRVAGIVSGNPAYLMNSDLDTENATAIALQGRVPCKVLGKVEKGDLLVTSAIPGYAVVDNNPQIGTVIGKALEGKVTDGKDIIEVVVGRV